jgi:hypothetical protein
MSTAPLRFQIISDLHLENPLQSPSYSYFSQPHNFPIHAPNLFLLGDIGLTKHPQLFTFLSTLLSTHLSLHIFYILGNHEPYHSTVELSISALQDFETKCNDKDGSRGRFHFLSRTRIDLSPTLTLLGCTLWTHIPPSCAQSCASLLTDFSEENGIWERSVEQHNLDHQQDLAWLNDSVQAISANEPGREIVVLTHHSPTMDGRANDKRHERSRTNAGFRTDLSGEVCWRSKRVRMWAFGHTHFSCQWYDGEGGKLVVANQKGYRRKDVEVVVVEARDGGGVRWKVVVGEKEGKVEEVREQGTGYRGEG